MLVSDGLCLLDENDSGDDQDQERDGQRAYTSRSHLLKKDSNKKMSHISHPKRCLRSHPFVIIPAMLSNLQWKTRKLKLETKLASAFDRIRVLLVLSTRPRCSVESRLCCLCDRIFQIHVAKRTMTRASQVWVQAAFSTTCCQGTVDLRGLHEKEQYRRG